MIQIHAISKEWQHKVQYIPKSKVKAGVFKQRLKVSNVPLTAK